MQEDILCLFALKLIQINQFNDVLDKVWFAVGWKSLQGISAGDDIIVWRVLWIDNSDSNWREAQRSDGKPSVWGESTGGKKQSDRFTVQPVLRRDAWNEHATHATTHPDAIYLPADGSMCVCVCVLMMSRCLSHVRVHTGVIWPLMAPQTWTTCLYEGRRDAFISLFLLRHIY